MVLFLYRRRLASIDRSETENKEQGENTHRDDHVQRPNHDGFCFDAFPVDLVQTVDSFVSRMEKEMSQQTGFPVPRLGRRSLIWRSVEDVQGHTTVDLTGKIKTQIIEHHGSKVELLTRCTGGGDDFWTRHQSQNVSGVGFC